MHWQVSMMEDACILVVSYERIGSVEHEMQMGGYY
jgi:hypothetical protein